MNEDRATLVRYRIKKAEIALGDAEFLAKANKWNLAVNRLYYSCFYSVSALMLCTGLTAKTHKGIRVLFYQHFISTSKLPKEMADFYARLFDARQESDYLDYVEYSSEVVTPWIDQTNEFVNSITTYVKEQFLTPNSKFNI